MLKENIENRLDQLLNQSLRRNLSKREEAEIERLKRLRKVIREEK
jgi:hypothetical protein